ncbi:MAG: hypothetical protein M1838_001407 [Thelocarpon superellum]|nr:MAG: hypothetical protein M1838_001407 [Thelocarpon superellum]
MGWLWGSSDDESAAAQRKDALSKLDPALREVLKTESPVKYDSWSLSTTGPPAPAADSRRYTRELSEQTTQSTESSSSGVPPQSLFPDGRYAHLWRDYQSQSAIEGASKTEQDKLQDVLEGYKFRKAEIGRAALENCALEQGAMNECFQSGGWRSRMNMCRAENRELERCYMMQAKFLKALGYLSAFDRPAEMDEQIQMHADQLYHRMLDQERATEKAKAAGLPPPALGPLIPSASAPAPPEASSVSERLGPDARKEFETRVASLSPTERELEEHALAAEIAVDTQIASRIGEQQQQEHRARDLRRAKGQETPWDRIGSWFGR